ncbi:hypothetical protein IFM89_006456 [Coptis chinensis]|uniref:Gamma-tubulin complex component n=1 Tax=Coptis chinensis TaxID=261450 RepID=A0A835MA00_9MAGN|nr:hypothetical protein IFM89_006456 [Coptis chinensis]
MGKLRSLKRYLLLDQSLLELALWTTAAAADPCHKDHTCCVERSSLLKRLSTLKDLDVNRSVLDSNGLEEPINVIGLETFPLIYKVQWPLSLTISRKALTKYQLIFHFLFHCEHVNPQLCGAWQNHQVLEPNWHVMHCKLQTAKSIDEVIRCHDFFLEKCLKECPLLLPEVLKVSHVICTLLCI